MKDTYNKRIIVGENIRRLRKKANPPVSQESLAKVAGFGKEKMRKVEEGLATIMYHQLEKIAAYLNVPVELFTSDNESQEEMFIEVNDILNNRPGELDTAVNLCLELQNFFVPGMMKYADTHKLLGKVYLKKGLFKKAYGSFRTYYDEIKSYKDKSLNYTACYNMALVNYYLKNYEESMFFIEEALDNKYSNNRLEENRYIHLKALLLLETDNFADSIGVFNELIEIYSDVGDETQLTKAFHNIAWAYLKLGNIEEAVTRYTHAFEYALSKNMPDQAIVTCYDLSRVYLNLGRIEDALLIIRRIISLSPLPLLYEVRVKFVLAKCLDDTCEKLKILDCISRSYEDIPDHDLMYEIYLEIARLLRDKGDLHNSINYYELACKSTKMKDVFDFY